MLDIEREARLVESAKFLKDVDVDNYDALVDALLKIKEIKLWGFAMGNAPELVRREKLRLVALDSGGAPCS